MLKVGSKRLPLIPAVTSETNARVFVAHREAKKGAEPAGLDIRCQSTDPDTISSFDLYETFEIEFESSPSTSQMRASRSPVC